MLNFFRRRDTVARLVLGGFLVLISIAMVLFLIPQGGAGSDSTAPLYQQTVASVNGTPITGMDLTTELTRVEQGQQIPAQLAPMFGHQVLKNLVIEQALADQARTLGLVPTTAEVVQAAEQQDPQLYPNGKYVGDALATQMVAQAQMTLQQFQDQLRQNLMVSKIYNLVTDPVRVSEDAVRAQFEKDNEKASFDYVLLKPADLESQVAATPAALAAYYQQHQATYNSPERRKLEVLLANQATIGAQIKVSDAEVHQYYLQNLATYTHPERVQVRQILIKFTSDSPSAAEIAATRVKAEDVLKQAQAKGADFAALAKKYSQDDATASLGGEVGFIQKGQTAPAFEQVAFSLPVGQISGLVQVAYGFHIIKAEAHDPASVQTEASAHDQIVQQLQKDQALDQAQKLIDQAALLAQKLPLAQVAQQLNLQYFDTTPLGRADPVTGIGVNPDFATAVFSTASGAVTAPVQVAQGFALAKVDAVIPPGPQPLAAVLDTVTADYKQAQSKLLAASKAQALAQAAAKQGLKAAAASLHLTMKTATALTRSGSLPDAGVISSFADTLFGLKPGAVGPVAALGDNQLVYALVSLQQPTDADYLQQRAKVTEDLVGQKRSAIFGAYTDALVAQLTKAGKIKYYDDAFQRVLGGGSNTPAPPSAPVSPGSGLG